MSLANEKVIETKQCKLCSTQFEITDKDEEFYDKISPIFNGKKYVIPAPKLCPDCRQQRRFTFRNERNLYKRKCDITGKDIVSIYSEKNKHIIYSRDYWWSDKWSAMSYGHDFNFDKLFFEQFHELYLNTPMLGVLNQKSHNSDYCNVVSGCNDSYLCFTANSVEDCLFSTNISQSSTIVDSYSVFRSENCYECIDVNHSSHCKFSINLDNVSNSMYCKDSIGIKDCIFCIGLTNTLYCILNKKYNKQDFHTLKGKIFSNKDLYEKYLKKYQELKINTYNKSNQILNSINCSGEYITDSGNCKYSFDIHDSQDIAYSSFGKVNNQDCYDVDAFINSSLLYEALSCVDTSREVFSQYCRYSSNILYSDNCRNCTYLFGCIGLCDKQYCVFNKQYTKDEYNILVPKIINHMIETGEWGEYFPSKISPFGYNETIAQEYFPLEKAEAINNNFNWSDYENPELQVDRIISALKLPDNINDIPDDVLNWAIECEVTKKMFRIIPQELEFYRKHNLPLPRRHPDQRHLDRIKLRNPRKLFKRDCDKCGIGMQTTYSPEREEVVYCEECYNKEVY